MGIKPRQHPNQARDSEPTGDEQCALHAHENQFPIAISPSPRVLTTSTAYDGRKARVKITVAIMPQIKSFLSMGSLAGQRDQQKHEHCDPERDEEEFTVTMHRSPQPELRTAEEHGSSEANADDQRQEVLHSDLQSFTPSEWMSSGWCPAGREQTSVTPSIVRMGCSRPQSMRSIASISNSSPHGSWSSFICVVL